MLSYEDQVSKVLSRVMSAVEEGRQSSYLPYVLLNVRSTKYLNDRNVEKVSDSRPNWLRALIEWGCGV